MPHRSQPDKAVGRREPTRISLLATDEVSIDRAGETKRVRLLPDGSLDPHDVLDATLGDMISGAIGPGHGDDLLCVMQQDPGRTTLFHIRQQSTDPHHRLKAV